MKEQKGSLLTVQYPPSVEDFVLRCVACRKLPRPQPKDLDEMCSSSFLSPDEPLLMESRKALARVLEDARDRGLIDQLSSSPESDFRNLCWKYATTRWKTLEEADDDAALKRFGANATARIAVLEDFIKENQLHERCKLADDPLPTAGSLYYNPVFAAFAIQNALSEVQENERRSVIVCPLRYATLIPPELNLRIVLNRTDAAFSKLLVATGSREIYDKLRMFLELKKLPFTVAERPDDDVHVVVNSWKGCSPMKWLQMVEDGNEPDSAVLWIRGKTGTDPGYRAWMQIEQKQDQERKQFQVLLVDKLEEADILRNVENFLRTHAGRQRTIWAQTKKAIGLVRRITEMGREQKTGECEGGPASGWGWPCRCVLLSFALNLAEGGRLR